VEGYFPKAFSDQSESRDFGMRAQFVELNRAIEEYD
jgi:hypothetical protein